MSSSTDAAGESGGAVLEAAAARIAEGDPEAAVAALFEAWSAEPGNRDLAVSYASLLAQAGREAEAEELFACLAEDMSDDGRVWNNWGYLLLARGQADLALAKLGRALELSPDDFEILVNTGLALDRLGRTAEAVSCHRRAAEVNPASPVVFNNMGAALWRAGVMEEALEAFRRALELNPRDSSAANNMGVIRMEADDYAEAEGYFRQALAIDPGSRAARRNLRELAKRKKLATGVWPREKGGAAGAFRRAQELRDSPPTGDAERPDGRRRQRKREEKCGEKPPSLF